MQWDRWKQKSANSMEYAYNNDRRGWSISKRLIVFLNRITKYSQQIISGQLVKESVFKSYVLRKNWCRSRGCCSWSFATTRTYLFNWNFPRRGAIVSENVSSTSLKLCLIPMYGTWAYCSELVDWRVNELRTATSLLITGWICTCWRHWKILRIWFLNI